MAQDKFQNYNPGLESQADRHYGITPNDSADLSPVPRYIYVSVGGTVVMRDKDGNNLSYELIAGQTLYFRPVRILATGTDPSVDLKAWY